jgi:hypothetical protein
MAEIRHPTLAGRPQRERWGRTSWLPAGTSQSNESRKRDADVPYSIRRTRTQEDVRPSSRDSRDRLDTIRWCVSQMAAEVNAQLSLIRAVKGLATEYTPDLHRISTLRFCDILVWTVQDDLIRGRDQGLQRSLRTFHPNSTQALRQGAARPPVLLSSVSIAVGVPIGVAAYARPDSRGRVQKSDRGAAVSVLRPPILDEI